MRFFRRATLGSLTLVSGLCLAPLCVLGCAPRARAPNLEAVASPQPAAAESSPRAVTEAAADASSRTDALLDASEGSHAADGGSAVSPTNESISPEELRQGTGFLAPASFRVRREIRERDLDSRMSAGFLTVDAQGTRVWSFDEPPLQLSITGYEIRSTKLCLDARSVSGEEWLALAPLQGDSASSFRLHRGLGDDGETLYVADLVDPGIHPRIATKVVYRALADGGLEAVVAQLRGKIRWRTVRYTLRPADAGQARPRKLAFAPCAQDAGVADGAAN
jgi:hypothetical protein